MSTRKPIALFNGSYIGEKPTGIGVVARDLSQALNPELVSFLDPLGSRRLGSMPIPGNLSPDFGTRGHLRRLIWTQFKLPLLIRKAGNPLLLSPLPEAPLLRGIRSIVLAHDLLPLRYPRISPLMAYHLTYVPFVLHSSLRILCNSEATAREIHNNLGINRKKLIKIPLGFDSSKLNPLNIARENFFLVLGRHDPHKNIQRVLRSFASFNNKDFELYIVGPWDDRYTPALKKLAMELGISAKCKWISWVTDEEKLQLLNRCQALVIVSLWEGFGIPALEAMACETPVIASNKGALPEVVGDSGLLVDPKDESAIVDAMELVVSNRNLRQSLILNGKSRLKIFSWERSVEVIQNILMQLS